jgi:hypothetical protein
MPLRFTDGTYFSPGAAFPAVGCGAGLMVLKMVSSRFSDESYSLYGRLHKRYWFLIFGQAL